MPICIAGMHRSGTSMVAKLLQACGLYLGPEHDLIPRARDNDEGFWEHRRFVELNDRILAELNGGWDLPPNPAESWEWQPTMSPYVDEARRLAESFADHQFWGWKDPRNSLTLPFWQRVFPDLRLVICIRNPIEVVQSLRKRSHSSEAFGLSLWLTYNERLLQVTERRHRIVCHYESFFHDPVGELTRLLHYLGMNSEPETIEQECAAVSLSLRHNRFGRNSKRTRPLPPSAGAVYARLCSEAGPIYESLSRATEHPSEQSSSHAAKTSLRQVPPAHAAYEGVIPASLPIIPTSRFPTMLPQETIEAALALPVAIPSPCHISDSYEEKDVGKRVSIVVATFNNLPFTKLCLTSVLANTTYHDYEIIVVDNNSTDGTREYLDELMRHNSNIRCIWNEENVGFAHATNQGLQASNGDVLLLLNNDTLVPRGWLGRLVRHLDAETVGLAGPVTNSSGNEAEIEVPYRTYEQFLEFAHEYQLAHNGARYRVPVLVMFCIAMTRQAYEVIGPLDEGYEIGMFEDDDYAVRARAAGYEPACAEDVFVHHFGQASLGKLERSGEFGALFHANRRRFEEKWGIPWETHHHRFNPRYQELTDRVREVVQGATPKGSRVLIVSKGDDAWMDLRNREGWHFPQDEMGGYAGYYPADSDAAIAHLETLRANGADFIAFPSTAFWWLEHYPGFRAHLRVHARCVMEDETCIVFALHQDEPAPVSAGVEGATRRERDDE